MKSRTLTRITVLLLVALATAAHAQTSVSVLYNFGSKSGDPRNPQYSGIIAQGRDGNLYSTAPKGGANGYGAVFKITPLGALSVLYSFDGIHGSSPTGGLTLGMDGNFYGTTTDGGTLGYGTIFKITPGGTLTTLYNFTGGADGKAPTAPPIQGTDGNFYGTASQGNGSTTYGSVYKIKPSGAFIVLHTFDGTDGSNPYAPLVQGTDGNFYGSAGADLNAATPGGGTVFTITPWGKLTGRLFFSYGSSAGYNPFAPVIQGSDGNLYGTTVNGGTHYLGEAFVVPPYGCFIIGGTSSCTLHNFAGEGASTIDGAHPYAGLVQASDGNLYGTTSLRTDTGGCGTFFRLTDPGGTSYQSLFGFAYPICSPQVTLVQHTNGILYGDAVRSGLSGFGTFFSINFTLPPFVSLLPYSGKVGNTIEFLGQGFTSSSAVSFNGTAATRTVVSGTYLTATVPNGATTGIVTVTTSGGKLNSNKIFRVTPQIASVSPTSGPVGTAVTITGVSLKQTTKVTFHGVKATFTVDSDTQVTAIVPTGALTGRIAITTPGGTATSATSFTVM
jgi:uncharacterized repeat protein (TIGR03803 family)